MQCSGHLLFGGGAVIIPPLISNPCCLNKILPVMQVWRIKKSTRCVVSRRSTSGRGRDDKKTKFNVIRKENKEGGQGETKEGGNSNDGGVNE